MKNSYFILLMFFLYTKIFGMQSVSKLEPSDVIKLNKRYNRIYRDTHQPEQVKLTSLMTLIEESPLYIDELLHKLNNVQKQKDLQKKLFVMVMLNTRLTQQDKLQVLERFTKQRDFTVNFSCKKSQNFEFLITPVHLAVEELDGPLITFLRDHNADLTVQIDGNTPLAAYEQYVVYLNRLGHKKPENYEDMINLLTPGK